MFRFALSLLLVVILILLGACSLAVVDDRPPEVARATQAVLTAEAGGVVTSTSTLEPVQVELIACPVKGNISRDGRKLYHLPGMANYDQVVIDPEYGEKYFCDEQDAIQEGWVKAGN